MVRESPSPKPSSTSMFEKQYGNQDPIQSAIQSAGDATNSGLGSGITLAAPNASTRVYLGAKAGPIGVIPLGGQAQSKDPFFSNQYGADTGYSSYGEAVLAPATSWSQSQIAQFVNQGIINKVPGFDVGMGMPQIQSAWQKMVDSSVLFNQGLKEGQKPWTPWDVLNSWSDNKGKFGTTTKDGWVYDVATGERLKYVGATTKTTKSTNLDLSSPEQVQAIAQSALQQALGRNPNAKELAQFKSTIAGYERAHPQVTTTTSQLTPDLATGSLDTTSQSSTTTGGVTDAERQQLVTDAAQKTPEYGKYQAANYFQMLLGMVGQS
jgi:hypothetical protein